MYHCHIQFYFTGRRRSILAPIREIPPLEHFTHTFEESGEPEDLPAARADVIFSVLQDMDAGKVLDTLFTCRKSGAEVILLADREQADLLVGRLDEAADVWILPMSEEELVFRFRKWQRSYKLRKDCWQTSQFLDACINGSPNLIWFKDRDGAHRIVNDSFCKAAGKTKEQIAGQRHAYIWNVACDDPACIESELEVMEKQTTCRFDETIRTGRGKKILKTYKSPLFDLDKSVMGTVGVALDVTKERAYEHAILEKNRMLEMLFATMDCGVMCHSTDGKQIISINRAALQLLGYESQEEMLADGFDLVAQSVLDEDKPKLRACIKYLTNIGDSSGVEYRVQHKDGKLLYILGNIRLIEKDGQTYYQRFLLDYTAQKLKEEAKWAEKNQELQYQEQIFRIFSTVLADNVDDIYVMLDIEKRKTEFVSPNVERILGMSLDSEGEDLEQQLGDAVYLTGEKPVWEALSRLEPGMPPLVMETERLNKRTGDCKWFRESMYCVTIQGAKKIIVYISDRTREKQTQNTLSDALQMAKVANKAKSAFLSNVSHDIRTPMNAVMGFITLLQEEAGNRERVLEYTQKISAASQHLLSLINDVLDMNKIESGSAVLNIAELNLADIIDEVNTIIRPQARAKGQTFDVFAPSLTYEHLLGDKLRINQILINILSNAVKYTPEGGQIKTVISELPQVDKKYSRIRFDIQDNGQGMSEEYQKVIFDPFTREQNTALNQIQGTGLGMAITKSLVDLMGGTISVVSKQGVGTTFTVELELHIQEEQEENPDFWKQHGITRMIVADDDQDICDNIVRKMAGSGVDTQYATSGAEAVAQIRAARERGEPYDLILLDWKMPDLDGLETARLIRQNYPDKIPILLFTAYDWIDIEKEALSVGINHFLPKPFFMSNFKDAIQRLMGVEKTPAIANGESVVQGKRILIVDDIAINRTILVKILGTLGAACDEVENGQAALEKFLDPGSGDYDIILMDIQMPVMNGYEATRAIRSSGHPSAESVAIIAMTANAFVDDIRDALDSGMDAHVSKPIVLDQLKASIQKVLSAKV